MTAATDAPAKLEWSEKFTANQITPGWNQTAVSATDAIPNTTTLLYGIYTVSPNASTPIYDLNGNMTSDGTNTYLWDAENRLVEIDYPGIGNNSAFTYDGLGRCVKIVETISSSVTSTKQFIWCGSKICEERNAGGTLVAQYFTQGELISGVAAYYYNKDHLGSIREVIDSSGNILSQYNYSPYGQVMKFSESVPSNFQYAGYYYHAPSGLNLTLNRAYNPSLCRWLNRDPIEESGGTNLYRYAGSNPIRFTDPLGLICGGAPPPPFPDDNKDRDKNPQPTVSDPANAEIINLAKCISEAKQDYKDKKKSATEGKCPKSKKDLKKAKKALLEAIKLCYRLAGKNAKDYMEEIDKIEYGEE